ncbi:MAG: HD-GYP domain-containing protein (c-di-GMP phosphodiesterase class II) [Oceanicoccus sp.]|jgi:HD-GYP domain-containing protein (c-di-GMP phosphodiesterase class II)
MANVKIANFDTDIVNDLKDELEEKRQGCNDHLLSLESKPDSADTINLLFRDVHTVKGDLGIMGISQYMPLLQAIEDILDTLRKKQNQYTPALGDVLLLSLDITFNELNKFINGIDDFDQEPYNATADLISHLATLSGHDYDQKILAILLHLAPETKQVEVLEEMQNKLYFTEQEINEEVAFFLQLSLLVDQRSPYGPGRTERMFDLAMQMNQLAGNPIDSHQLQTALYLHDLAMAFLPKGMANKASPLSHQDWQWVKSHVQLVHKLISSFEVWNPAAEIILHHHERIDGSGYPNALKEGGICEGAKLLAIVDTFEAITQTRAHQQTQQRPIVRAIVEINQRAGSLFCPIWVEHFNQAVKRLHIKKAKK